jgi:predicted RNase H-like nuclease
MSPELQNRVREVHPELCFREMNNGKPIQESKNSPEGFRRRMEIIKESGFSQIGDWLRRYPKTKVAADDILDACAACWTAERIHRGVAVRVPSEPEKDSRGLRMEMWA